MASDPAAKAEWTVNVTRRSADGDGVLHVEATVSDGAVPQADIVWTLTPDRALRIDVTMRDGVPPLTDFQAWSSA